MISFLNDVDKIKYQLRKRKNIFRKIKQYRPDSFVTPTFSVDILEILHDLYFLDLNALLTQFLDNNWKKGKLF